MKYNIILLLVCCFISLGIAEDISLISQQDIMELEIESSFIPEMLPEDSQNYIKNDVYPQTQPFYIDLRSQEQSIEKMEITKENILADYLDYYFSSENSYVYSLNEEDTKNSKNLECLLLNKNKVLLFLNITSDWKLETFQQTIQNNNTSVIGSQGLLLVGFDHQAKYFIVKTCWEGVGENGYIFLSYEYVKEHALCSFYEHISNTSEISEVRNVNFDVTKWDVGGGNIFFPRIKIYGNITGHPAFIKWLRVVIEFSSKRRVVIKQIIVKSGDRFVFKEKYTRLNSRYCSLECTNNDFEVTRFIKRRIE